MQIATVLVLVMLMAMPMATVVAVVNLARTGDQPAICPQKPDPESSGAEFMPL